MSVLSVLSVKGGDTPLTDKIRKVSFGIFITQMMNNCKKRDYTEQQMLQANIFLVLSQMQWNPFLCGWRRVIQALCRNTNYDSRIEIFLSWTEPSGWTMMLQDEVLKIGRPYTSISSTLFRGLSWHVIKQMLFLLHVGHYWLWLFKLDCSIWLNTFQKVMLHLMNSCISPSFWNVCDCWWQCSCTKAQL